MIASRCSRCTPVGPFNACWSWIALLLMALGAFPEAASAQTVAWTARKNGTAVDGDGFPAGGDTFRGKRALAVDGGGNVYGVVPASPDPTPPATLRPLGGSCGEKRFPTRYTISINVRCRCLEIVDTFRAVIGRVDCRGVVFRLPAWQGKAKVANQNLQELMNQEKAA